MPGDFVQRVLCCLAGDRVVLLAAASGAPGYWQVASGLVDSVCDLYPAIPSTGVRGA